MSLQHDQLQMDVRCESRAVVVTVRGSAGMVHAHRVRMELEHLTEHPGTNIILDLSELEFIGADGVDAILAGRELSRMRKGQIRLVNPGPNVRRLLEITRLTQVMPIYASVEEAMADLTEAG
jgi:anti-sigma B factor antagonist